MANPYLPQWEYIPDGEPRVFGDRVYVTVHMTRLGRTASATMCLSAGVHRLII